MFRISNLDQYDFIEFPLQTSTEQLGHIQKTLKNLHLSMALRLSSLVILLVFLLVHIIFFIFFMFCSYRFHGVNLVANEGEVPLL